MDYEDKSEDRDSSQKAVAKVQAKLAGLWIKLVVMGKKSRHFILFHRNGEHIRSRG